MIVPRLAASWMAAAVIGLTATARAQAPAQAEGPASGAALAPAATVPASPPAPAPAVALAPSEPTATPLALRPSKPLELSKEPASGGSVGWKLGAIVLVLGGAAFFVRKRFQPPRFDDASLSIVRRVPVGFRSELVVVDVEGQRLLLGVTPGAIQMLATLDTDDASGALGSTVAGAAAESDQRFAALLDAADRRPSRPRAEAASASQPVREPREEPVVNPDDVAGQARGLLALRGRR